MIFCIKIGIKKAKMIKNIINLTLLFNFLNFIIIINKMECFLQNTPFLH